MAEHLSEPAVQLFYSYSHKDARHKESMEKALALLQVDGLLQQWSDQQILPGQSISTKVRERMDQANILVFLFSPDFIASSECRKEWDYAAKLNSSGKTLFRIPIILRDCSWKDLLDVDDVKALPNDGSPVTQFTNEDVAWKQVYVGIKAVVNQLRATFTPRQEFLDEIDSTCFLSQSHLKLRDLYVFLRMTCNEPQGPDQPLRDTTISNQVDLMNAKRALIHGSEKCGKTAFVRHLYLSLVEEAQPALLVDLAQTAGRLDKDFFKRSYQSVSQKSGLVMGCC